MISNIYFLNACIVAFKFHVNHFKYKSACILCFHFSFVIIFVNSSCDLLYASLVICKYTCFPHILTSQLFCVWFSRFLIIQICLYLKMKERERGSEGEKRQRSGGSPKYPQQLASMIQKLGTRNSIQDSLWVARSQLVDPSSASSQNLH